MAITVGNWVGEFSNTTGQGDIVFAGPIQGYTTFASIAGDDVDFWYAIVDGENREAGVGNYNAGIFKRTTVYSTLINGSYISSGATPLDLSGAAEIYSTFNKTAFDEFVAHIADTNIHFPDAPVDGFSYNRKDGAWAIASTGGGGSGGGSTEISVQQTAHGFSVLDCVRFDSPSAGYTLALADDPATLAIGVVTSITSADEFVLSLTGIYPTVHGLAEETWWYLSDTVPGQLTEIEPDISQPIVYTQGPSSFLVFEYRPSSPTEIEVFGGAGLPGIVPDPVTELGYYLRDDATWQPVSGGGGGQVDSVRGGDVITVDSTDPISPIVNFDDAPDDQNAYGRFQQQWTAVTPVIAFNAHVNNTNNPHDTSWSNLTGTPPEFAGAGTTGYVPDPLTEQDHFLADDGTFKQAPVSPIGGGYLNMRFDSNTDTTTEPALGDVRVNDSGDHLAATQLATSNTTVPGNDAGIIWDTIHMGDYVGLWETGGDHEGVTYYVTGANNMGTWTQLDIVAVAGQSNTGIDNNRALQVYFVRNPLNTLPPDGDTGQSLTKNSATDFDMSWQDKVSSVVAGTGVAVDATDPLAPVVSSPLAASALQSGDNVSELVNDAGYVTETGGQVDSVVAGTNVTVDNTDPANPIVSATGGGGDSYWEPGTDPNDIINTNTGNVKIGETLGSNKLEVAGNITARNPNGLGNVMAGNWSTAPIAGTVLGRVTFQGTTDSGATVSTGSRVQSQAKAVWSGSDSSADMTFWTTPIGDSTPATRMTISSEGYVGIGVADPEQQLDIQGSGYAAIRLRGAVGPHLFFDSDANDSKWTLMNVVQGQNDPRMRFVDSGNERWSINNSGEMKGAWSWEGGGNNQSQFKVVTALPGTPDANTIYFVTG